MSDQSPLPQTKPSQKPDRLGSERVPDEDAFGALVDVYPFGREDIQFLAEFQRDLDWKRALEAAGLPPTQKQINKMTDIHTRYGQAVMREVARIQDDWTRSIRMNAHASARKHLELMEKFEKDYDGMDLKNQNKSGLSSTLARMSDASLKATGHYGQEKQGSGLKVEINIDLGGLSAPADPIEGEIVESVEADG